MVTRARGTLRPVMSPFASLLVSLLRRGALVAVALGMGGPRLCYAQAGPEAMPAAAAQPAPPPSPGTPYPMAPGQAPVYPPYQPYPPYSGYPAYPAYPPYPMAIPQPSPAYPGQPGSDEPGVVQAAPGTPTDAEAKRFFWGATLGSTAVSEDQSTTVLFSPLLEGAFAWHRLATVRAAWGFAWAIDGQGLGESTARTGNPMLSAAFHTGDGSWRLRAGLGVTAPAAHLPLGTDGRLYAFTYNQTLALWGMWNQWLWTPDRMAVPAEVSVGYLVAGRHWIDLEVAPALLIGVRGDAHGSNFVGQVALEAELAVTPSLTLCPRWQTVRLPSGGIDLWQSAIGLRVALATAAGRFFAGLLVDLDEPVGILGGMGRWGVHLGKEMDL